MLGGGGPAVTRPGPIMASARATQPAQAVPYLQARQPRSLAWARPAIRPCRRAVLPVLAAAAAAADGAGDLVLGHVPSSAAAPARARFSPWARTTSYDKEIWAVALPALVAMLLEPVMGAINAALVGHLGTPQLSAVGIGTLAVSFCTFLFSFLLFLTVPEIAAAVVKGDKDEVSCIAAKGLWIGLVCGVLSTAVLQLFVGPVVAVLNPPEAAVANYAKQFIQIRAWGITPALLGFVATGVFRGFKDTRTPLTAAFASAACSLSLNLFLLYGLKLGVAASATATTVSGTVSCVLLMSELLRSGKVQLRHLSRPPPLAVMLPTLKQGSVLGLRNVVSFGMVLYSSALCIRLGSTHQAAFEVIRQVWILTIQFFECLNVAAQSICASYLGKKNIASARESLARMVALGAAIGALVGGAVWVAQDPLVAFFTADPAVVRQVAMTLPMICAFFPLDAVAAIMDGALLASKQSNFMSVTQMVGAGGQYVALAWLASTGNAATFSVWAALKMQTLARIGFGLYRNYASEKSAYVQRHAQAAELAFSAGAASSNGASAPLSSEREAVAVVGPAHGHSNGNGHIAPQAAAGAAAAAAATQLAAASSALNGSNGNGRIGHAADPSSAGAAAAAVQQEDGVGPASSSSAAGGDGGDGEVLLFSAGEALSSMDSDAAAVACASCGSATEISGEMMAALRSTSGGGSGSSNANN